MVKAPVGLAAGKAMLAGVGGVKVTTTGVVPTARLANVHRMLLPEGAQLPAVDETEVTGLPRLVDSNAETFKAVSGPLLISPKFNFIAPVRLVVTVVPVTAPAFDAVLLVAVNGVVAMSMSAVRCKVVFTVVPLLLLPAVVSNVETWVPRATVAPRAPVATAPAPVIEVRTGGVMSTVMATELPLARGALVVQSMFPALSTHVALVGTPTTSGVVTAVEVSAIVDFTFSAISGPTFLMV